MKSLFKSSLVHLLFLVFSFQCVAQSSMQGYLFAYFEGTGADQEAIRFAVSDDAVHWKALNQNNPIIPSAAISNTGGVRDPHLLRGAEAGADPG